MIPGARKSRYDRLPVGMAWMRLNVSPKISSQRIGCTARVKSSLRSCESFCSSTRQNVATRLGKRCQTGTSTEAARGPPSATDFTETSLRLFGEAAAGELAEHVL